MPKPAGTRAYPTLPGNPTVPTSMVYKTITEALEWGGGRFGFQSLKTLGIKTAQQPYIVGSLGPKALIYESLDS